MAIAGFSDGKHSVSGEPKLMPTPEQYYREKIPAAELAKIMDDCRTRGLSCHNALMDRVGWPAIPYDGQLLVSQQDALLMGGKVQAAPGYADHVRFLYPDFCERCVGKTCPPMCSGQAITVGAFGVPMSIARSASTVGPASGIAGRSWMKTPRGAIFPSPRARGDCTRRRIRWRLPPLRRAFPVKLT